MAEQAATVYQQIDGLPAVAAVVERVFDTMERDQEITPSVWRHFETVPAEELATYKGVAVAALAKLLGADTAEADSQKLAEWHGRVPFTSGDVEALGSITMQASYELGMPQVAWVVEQARPLLYEVLIPADGPETGQTAQAS